MALGQVGPCQIRLQVSINEAVELAKRFDTEDSYTFVNGVLGAAEKMLSAEKKESCEQAELEKSEDNA